MIFFFKMFIFQSLFIFFLNIDEREVPKPSPNPGDGTPAPPDKNSKTYFPNEPIIIMILITWGFECGSAVHLKSFKCVSR